MKTKYFLTTLALLFFLSNAGKVLAQPGDNQPRFRGHGEGREMGLNIPNLTEEQKAKIKELRITHFKEAQTFHNQLGELKAKELTLATVEKPDMKAIYANIDEITKVQNSLMRSKAAFQQQIRALLTDEQKLWFDSRPVKHEQMMKKRMGNKFHELDSKPHE
jgi:Spy/CpxP family protein refolding chaperone